MRVARLLITLAALALLAASCTPERRVGDGTQTIEVSLEEFKITPSRTAPAGAPFVLKVTNDGQTAHNMAIEARSKVFETPALKTGESALLRVPALDSGSYTLWCTVPGHREAGMETRLVVSDGKHNTGTSAS